MKHSFYFSIIALLVLLTACGKSESQANAEDLLSQAETALQAKNTVLAKTLIDSINSAYRAETAVRKQANLLMTRVIECETQMEITSTDSLMAWYADRHNTLKEKMKLINDPQLVEPYYVAKAAYKQDFVNTTGIQARVDEIGQFYVVSSLKGNSIRHTSVTITINGKSPTTADVPRGSDDNFAIEGSELVTYLMAQCDTIGKFAAENRGEMGKLTFNGAKKHSIQMSPAQIAAIADAYEFSQSIVQSRELAIKLEMLERKLQLSRDQIARQTPEE